MDEVDALRKFLGDRKMTKTMYLERGLALDILVDTFFKKWSAVSGRHMDRRIVFNCVQFNQMEISKTTNHKTSLHY